MHWNFIIYPQDREKKKNKHQSETFKNLQYAKENKNICSYDTFLWIKFSIEGYEICLKDFASQAKLI